MADEFVTRKFSKWDVATQEERFWSKVEKTSSCWLWRGGLWLGYGQTTWNGKNARPHRVSYELANGPIPKGLVLDHLCRVKNCVRPEHLEATTDRTNILRGVGWGAINARRTKCKNGHPFEGDNLILRPNGGRMCRRCRQIHQTTVARPVNAAAYRRRLAKKREANPLRQCLFIRARYGVENGLRCKQVAVGDTPFCHYHRNTRLDAADVPHA